MLSCLIFDFVIMMFGKEQWAKNVEGFKYALKFCSIPIAMWFNILSNYVLNFCVICSCNWIVASSVFKDIRFFVSFKFLSILSHFFFFSNISKYAIFYYGKEIFQTINSTSHPKLSQKIQTLTFDSCYVIFWR